MVQQGFGKRAGSRRTSLKARRIDPTILLLSLGITVLVVAWGYLVKAAIDFGASGREGEGIAWVFLLLACVGAAGCLFAGLILVAKLLALIGILPETATGPKDAELGTQKARDPDTVRRVTDTSTLYSGLIGSASHERARLLESLPDIEVESEAMPEVESEATPDVTTESEREAQRRFEPPAPTATTPATTEDPAPRRRGSHAAVVPEGEEPPHVPNPRYPGGKRAAR